jgi:hypothetical protein
VVPFDKGIAIVFGTADGIKGFAAILILSRNPLTLSFDAWVIPISDRIPVLTLESNLSVNALRSSFQFMVRNSSALP